MKYYLVAHIETKNMENMKIYREKVFNLEAASLIAPNEGKCPPGNTYFCMKSTFFL